jgi:hypothetical protein
MDANYTRGPGSGGTIERWHAKVPMYGWLAAICISSLTFLSTIAFVLNRQVTSTEIGASGAAIVSDNQSLRLQEERRDERCSGGSCLEIVAGPPEDQKSGPDAAAPLPEAPKSGPGVIAPSPEAQKSGPDAAAPPPEAQKSGLDAIGPPPEAQKSGSDAIAPPPKVKSEREPNEFALPQLELSDDEAQKVGHQIWLNETGGNRDAIIDWNASEEFASLGIGHFIWFPDGKKAPFDEDFPRVLDFLRMHNAHLPSWVDRAPIPPCPWMTRADFVKNFNSPEMRQLREFLLDTVAGQTQFLVVRTQGTLDKILNSTPDSVERRHIITQFTRVAQASKDLYPLIDYVNFKGEGTDLAETALDKQTGVRQGWGLKQVLLRMSGTTSDPAAVLAEFSDAARFVLRERVHHIPANRIWEAGWLRRVETYRRPIGDREPKRTRTAPARRHR